jgi:hypothetical protein
LFFKTPPPPARLRLVPFQDSRNAKIRGGRLTSDPNRAR